MAKPMKGDEAVDADVSVKIKEVCRYLNDNLHQLSQEVLEDIMRSFDEANSKLKAMWEVRLKQGLGGQFVARIHGKIGSLVARVEALEKKQVCACAESKPVTEDASDSPEVVSEEVSESVNEQQ